MSIVHMTFHVRNDVLYNGSTGYRVALVELWLRSYAAEEAAPTHAVAVPALPPL